MVVVVVVIVMVVVVIVVVMVVIVVVVVVVVVVIVVAVLGDIPSCMYPFIYPSYHSHFTFILLYLHSFVIVWLSP